MAKQRNGEEEEREGSTCPNNDWKHEGGWWVCKSCGWTGRRIDH